MGLVYMQGSITGLFNANGKHVYTISKSSIHRSVGSSSFSSSYNIALDCTCANVSCACQHVFNTVVRAGRDVFSGYVGLQTKY